MSSIPAAQLGFEVDGKEVAHEELVWQSGTIHKYETTLPWTVGEHSFGFTLDPLTPVEKKVGGINVRVSSVVVEGPLERDKWSRPANFDRFFSKDVPADAEGRRAYAREVLGKFATKAYRRPVEPKVVDRLVAVAEEAYTQPGKTFEQGIARAFTAILASPRFLFRVEDIVPEDANKPFGRIDEYALASRLSYFLWSTMPDDELFKLAEKGELRKNLPAQVKRLLDDYRSDRFVRNFVGQWLQRATSKAWRSTRGAYSRTTKVMKRISRRSRKNSACSSPSAPRRRISRRRKKPRDNAGSGWRGGFRICSGE